MGVPYNKTQVIQTALNLLGFPLIQSIEAGGPGAAAMDNLIDGLLAADLSSPNWRFATKAQQLSLIAGVDPDFWWYTHAYQIPPDCLAIWQVWPPVPYEVFGERLWTCTDQELWMEYRHAGPLTDPTAFSKYPPAYIMYFCHLLALTVAPGITEDPKIIDRLEANKTQWRAQAMVVNSQGRPNGGLMQSTWIGARSSGSAYGTGRGGW